MERFTYTNTATEESMTIGYDSSCLLHLLEYDGLTNTEVLPKIYNGYQQYGNTVSRIGIGVRIITIKFMIASNNIGAVYGMRKNMARVFSPLSLGTLKYENDATTVVLEDVEVSVQPSPTKRLGLINEYEVELTAHNPFFRSNVLYTVNLNGSEQTINYYGDIPAPYIFRYINNTSSNITSGYMRQYFGSTVKQMMYDIEIPAGTHKNICNAYGKKGVNAITNTTFNDTWLPPYGISANNSHYGNGLEVGANRFVYSTAGTKQVSYYNWYSGV